MIRVAAAVIMRDGQILICQRKRQAKFSLKWEFPGGKLKAQETAQQALQRELREELGISATIGREIHRARHDYGNPGAYEIAFFTAEIGAQVVRNCAFAQIVWAEPSKLASYDFLAANAAIVKLLASGAIGVG